MALVLLLLAAWIALNVALLGVAAALDRRHGPDVARISASRSSGRVVRLPRP